MFLEQFYSDEKQTRAKKHPLKDDVEKIEYINCKLNGTNPNCTSSIRVESWDKNFAIRMNKSNNNLQQKLQSPSGPLAAVCSKLK